MIRAAQQTDLNAITEILEQAVPGMQASGNRQWDSDYPNRARFEADLAAGTLYVCEQDGQVAGFIVSNTELPPEYDGAAWQTTGPAMALHRMAVAPDFRGRGLAAGMIAFCEGVARKKGFASIHTDTNSKNAPVNALLQKMGYRFCGTVTLRGNPDLFNCYEKQL